MIQEKKNCALFYFEDLLLQSFIFLVLVPFLVLFLVLISSFIFPVPCYVSPTIRTECSSTHYCINPSTNLRYSAVESWFIWLKQDQFS